MMTHVGRLKKVKIGDLLISSGKGLVFPQGFLLGKIISAQPNGMHFDIIVEPVVDVSSIEYCYLLQKESSIIEHTKDVVKN